MKKNKATTSVEAATRLEHLYTTDDMFYRTIVGIHVRKICPFTHILNFKKWFIFKQDIECH